MTLPLSDDEQDLKALAAYLVVDDPELGLLLGSPNSDEGANEFREGGS